MRREDFFIGTYHHITLRGARGMRILCGDSDWLECNKLLYYLNDSFMYTNWKRDIAQLDLFERPTHWPDHDPLIKILAYCLHANHIHILVKEIKEGGISDFMRRFPKSLTVRYNKKYGGSGSIFQGPYQSRIINSDSDLILVALYIMAKNVFERYPAGGIESALQNFEDAYGWAKTDPFSSFPDFASDRNSPIVSKDILTERFSTPNFFKKEVREYLKLKKERGGWL